MAKTATELELKSVGSLAGDNKEAAFAGNFNNN
jgi:hypothetical protein